MRVVSWSVRFAGAGLLLVGLVLPGCSGTAPAPVADAMYIGEIDGDAVIEAHERFLGALAASDIATVLSLLDPSAELLIFHPRLESRFDGVREVELGLERMFAHLGRAEWTEVHASVNARGGVAWITGHIAVVPENLGHPVLVRATEIWVWNDGAWKLIHGHWSEDPEG